MGQRKVILLLRIRGKKLLAVRKQTRRTFRASLLDSSQDRIVEGASLDMSKHSVVRHKEISNEVSSLDKSLGSVSMLKRTGGMGRPPDPTIGVHLKGKLKKKTKSKEVSCRNEIELPPHFSVDDLVLVEDVDGKGEAPLLVHDDDTHIE